MKWSDWWLRLTGWVSFWCALLLVVLLIPTLVLRVCGSQLELVRLSVGVPIMIIVYGAYTAVTIGQELKVKMRVYIRMITDFGRLKIWG